MLSLASEGDKSGNALYVSVSFGSLDISCVDHLPEELIVVTIQGLSFSMAMGIGPEGTFQRMQLSLQNLQIDDQLSASRCVGCMTSMWLLQLLQLCAFVLTAQECLHSKVSIMTDGPHSGLTYVETPGRNSWHAHEWPKATSDGVLPDMHTKFISAKMYMCCADFQWCCLQLTLQRRQQSTTLCCPWQSSASLAWLVARPTTLSSPSRFPRPCRSVTSSILNA